MQFSGRLEKQLGCAEHFGDVWFPGRKVREMTVYLEHLCKACWFGLPLGSCHLMLNPKSVQSWFVLNPVYPDGEGCVVLDLRVWIPYGISEPAVEAFVCGTVELQPLLQAQLCSERAGGA